MLALRKAPGTLHRARAQRKVFEGMSEHAGLAGLLSYGPSWSHRGGQNGLSRRFSSCVCEGRGELE